MQENLLITQRHCNFLSIGLEQLKPYKSNEMKAEEGVVGRLVVSLSPIIRLWDLGLQVECPPWGSCKGSQPVFPRVSEKTTDNSERLGRQARPGFEPGTSRLPVLSVTAVPPSIFMNFIVSLMASALLLCRHRD